MGRHNESNVLDYVVYPKYIQLFYGMYRCIGCNELTKRLLCDTCACRMSSIDVMRSNRLKLRYMVFGGQNGFGRIIAGVCDSYGFDVITTSRKQTGDNLVFQLELGATQEVIKASISSDILVMNATKTLDNDETIWNTRLNTFDEKLLYDRIDINVCGYVRLLRQICQSRIKYMEEGNELRKQIIIYVDANESRCEGKMVDCKHLELNIAKSGVKQIFYTNSILFSKLNMIVVCYDPGWLSFHGISIEEKKAKSSSLIIPNISAKGIVDIGCNVLGSFELFLRNSKIIFDWSVYDFIKKSLPK